MGRRKWVLSAVGLNTHVHKGQCRLCLMDYEGNVDSCFADVVLALDKQGNPHYIVRRIGQDREETEVTDLDAGMALIEIWYATRKENERWSP